MAVLYANKSINLINKIFKQNIKFRGGFFLEYPI